MEAYYWAYSPQTLNWEPMYFPNKKGTSINMGVRICLCPVCINAFNEKRGKNFEEVFES